MLIDEFSKTFLGLTVEWTGVVVSLFALVVASLGFRELIKGKKDTQSQIDSLSVQATEMSKVAIHMAHLAQLQRDQIEATRKKDMPRFKITDSSGGHTFFAITLINNGGKIENLQVNNQSDVLFVCEQNERSIEPQGRVQFQWSDRNRESIHRYETLSVRLIFSDIYGYSYFQDVTKPKANNVDITETMQLL